ncbi:iron chelate uptake ABC transporter family permease subunit [Algicella marina]|uniref:Iron chelate uptake ABC transporter family permease subunit n=1 Tax=Algicella marina TaxID=2683284 RepID=A0A6P1T1J0_9RHOB|nr:iron chelate uptake ABC transporter family permease subunit [Algicella marina]QHQ35149.1 iron chelate uptake ABC transporter family permease subunit [Algicella marina]
MQGRRLLVLAAMLAVCSVLYMTIGARGSWSFVLPFRGAKLAALLVVGVAVATSTLLFQTVTRNRILTPSIMGFDALYVLLLSLAVFFLGAQSYLGLSQLTLFFVTLVALTVGALALFSTLLSGSREDLMRMVLTGVIVGVLFRSLSGLVARMIDPNEYSVIQVDSFARFNAIETELLGITAAVCGVAVFGAWRLRHVLDVLALGNDAAINLGVDPRRRQMEALLLISVLVAASTALVGPVAFLGLLVVNLAYLLVPSANHAVMLPAAALIAGITLVGGQIVLERILGLATPLSVVIDLIGGAVFLVVLMRRGVR